MNEAERRRQLKKPAQDSHRPIRSANASPQTAHQFLVNALHSQQQPYTPLDH